MELTLIRDEKGGTYTAGRLYIDGEYWCDTLEDRWRDLLGLLGFRETKVYGETCIPEGTYEVVTNIKSPRYAESIRRRKAHPLAYTEGYIPRLLHVPYFDGILIHTGNTIRDTNGCILVGESAGDGRLIHSNEVFKRLYNILKGNKHITIEIKSQWTV